MDYFKPKNAAHSHLLTRPRPAGDTDWACYISSEDGFEAFIHKSVLNQIHHEAKQAAPDETIGLLAGRVWRDEAGPYTLVMISAGARRNEIEATPSHVRISGDGLAQVRERLEADNPALEVVGWFHSHPTYRAQFSATDRVEQSTWSDPNHIGIVYSALPGETPYGIYRGPEAVMLSPKRAPVLPVPPIGNPTGYADPFVTRFIGAGEKAATPELASPGDNRPQPDGALKPGTATNKDPGKDAPFQRAGSLLVWIIALGFAGTILSINWVSYRVHALQTQLTGLAQTTSRAAESSHPTPGSSATREAGQANPPTVEPTPDAQQAQSSTEKMAGPNSGDTGRRSSAKDKPKAHATDADSATKREASAPPSKKEQ